MENEDFQLSDDLCGDFLALNTKSIDGPWDPDNMRAVEFYVPLPEPLGIPDETTISLTKFSSSVSSDDEVHVETEDGYARALWGSLRFRQVMTSIRFHGLQEAMSVATANGSDTVEPAPLDSAPPNGTVTIVKTVVFLDLTLKDPLTDAFDRALLGIQDIQLRYYLVTQQAISSVNLRKLPVFIPYRLGELTQDSNQVVWEDSINLFLVNDESGLSDVLPGELSPDDLKRVFEAPYDTANGPFANYIRLRREALLAHREHNTVTAASLIGAAGEALFRELALTLAWEEGKLPADIAEYLKGRPQISKVIKTDFHERLGGAWQPNQTGPVGQWNTSVKNLRDRVLHAGFNPTVEDIEKGIKASTNLEHFVSDRLAASFNTYPLTAWFFLGPTGFEQRHIMNSWIKFTETSPLPADLAKSFSNWRHELDRHTNEGPFTGDLDHADLVLVLCANGEQRWWLVDQTAKLACLAQVPQLPEAQQTSLDKRLRDPDLVGHELSITVAVGNLPQPLQTQPGWLPLADTMPLRKASRYEDCLLPPPLDLE